MGGVETCKGLVSKMSRVRKKTFKKTPWVQFINGAAFDLEDFEHDLRGLKAAGVVRQLSHIARFNGSTAFHYSVAQHSVLVADYISEAGGSAYEQLHGLLHDVHEVVVGDVVTPLKRHYDHAFNAGYERLCAEAERRLYPLFGLSHERSPDIDQLVKLADQMALAQEKYALCGHRYGWNLPRLRAVCYRPIQQLTPPQAEELFLRRWWALQDKMMEEGDGRLIKGFWARREVSTGENGIATVLMR